MIQVGQTIYVPNVGEAKVIKYLGTRYRWGIWLVQYGRSAYGRVDQDGKPVADEVTTDKKGAKK